ncbi:metal-sulfur cluster assembly factor [Coprobacter fastidiosus]|jgi:FeS assembly SUF system protein|uniref:metal-sulfur cluster assembly factor n=1 Tax=Coprobacter fastidiosus TaxID=1099853 RepID=UPI000240EB0E|nr:iron-sulfur cluster assembly protein [Coprobacter fastidiosus]EHL85168.1 FeS assembly SUF system protein [Tannerella sp. 6_1_58FAA_CT1]
MEEKENDILTVEEKIVKMLRTVYDPEIPVNVYDLGLIYSIEVDEEKNVHIEMTLTAPNCPAADFIVEDVRMKIESIDDVKSVDIQLVFEPEWDKDMMSEEAKLELGFL